MTRLRFTLSAALLALAAASLVACDDAGPDDGSADSGDATQISDTAPDATGTDATGTDATGADATGADATGTDAAETDATETDATEADGIDLADGSETDAIETCVARACTATMCATHGDGCGAMLECGPCADPASVADDLVAVDALIQTLVDQSYMTEVVPGLDPVALRAEIAALLAARPDGDAALIEALYTVVQAFANGHTGVYSTTAYCASFGGGDATLTRYAACARPLADAFVVTTADATNPLELAVGERILAVNGARGTEMVDTVLQAPLCGNGAGNAETRREQAATSLFASLEAGDVIEVGALDGSTRQIAVPAPLPPNQSASCTDPFGRDTRFVAQASLRSDGVAVIRVPRLAFLYGDPRAELPFDQYLDALTEEVGAAFDEVAAEATAIVWDLRSNIGGASPVGFAVAAGMTGAAPGTALARCTTRIPASDPIDYWVGGPDYDLDANDRFAFDGPSALLIDGLSISAADYTARAVELGTDALIVGRPSAGAWGGGGNTAPLYAPLDLIVGYDPYRCNDLDGNALETRSVQPHLWVEYAPDDLAAGRDTVLEAAVTALFAE